MSGLPDVPEEPLEAGDWCKSLPPLQLFEIPDDASGEIRTVSEAFQNHCSTIYESAVAQIVQSNDDRERACNPDTQTDEEPESALPSGSDSSAQSSPQQPSKESPASSVMSDIDTGPFKGKEVLRPQQGIEEVSKTMKKLFSSPKVSRALKKGRIFAIGQKIVQGDAQQSESITVECASCFDDTLSQSAVRLACQHNYCIACFVHLIETSMSNENFWPPRCCLQELPRKEILRYLPDGQLQAFGDKEREYATPADQRWYCSRRECGKWFKPRRLGFHVQCPHCRHQMCPHCRGARHQGKDQCTQDAALAALEEEALIEGWMHCPQCRALIELTSGCRHITCRCRHEFCFVCSARWHTCNCTEDDKMIAQLATSRRKQVRDLEQAELQRVAEAEAAARTEQEQRLLREKHFAEAIEHARTDAISTHFRALRRELNAVHKSQSGRILQCLKSEMNECMDLSCDLEAQEARLSNELAAKKKTIEKQLSEAEEVAATAEIEMTRRQAADRMKIFEKLATLVNQGYCNSGNMQSWTDRLVIEQVKEQKMRQERRDYKRAKLEWRLAHCEGDPAYAEKLQALKKHRQENDARLAELGKRAIANDRWTKLAAAERPALLQGAEAHLISSGGEIPGTKYPNEEAWVDE